MRPRVFGSQSRPAGIQKSSKNGLEAKKLDALRVMHLVHRRELRGQVLLRHIGSVRVDDVEHKLLPAQQWVLLELPGPHREVRHDSLYAARSLLRSLLSPLDQYGDGDDYGLLSFSYTQGVFRCRAA